MHVKNNVFTLRHGNGKQSNVTVTEVHEMLSIDIQFKLHTMFNICCDQCVSYVIIYWDKT